MSVSPSALDLDSAVAPPPSTYFPPSPIHMHDLNFSQMPEISNTPESHPPDVPRPDVKCEKCQNPLGTKAAKLQIGKNVKLWHPECLACYNCRFSLQGRWTFVKENSIFCKHCYRLMYRYRCSNCLNPIHNDGDDIRAMDVRYHQKCFKCAVCATVLKKCFATSKNQPYCLKCFEKVPLADRMTEKAIIDQEKRWLQQSAQEAITARKFQEEEIFNDED